MEYKAHELRGLGDSLMLKRCHVWFIADHRTFSSPWFPDVSVCFVIFWTLHRYHFGECLICLVDFLCSFAGFLHCQKHPWAWGKDMTDWLSSPWNNLEGLLIPLSLVNVCSWVELNLCPRIGLQQLKNVVIFLSKCSMAIVSRMHCWCLHYRLAKGQPPTLLLLTVSATNHSFDIWWLPPVKGRQQEQYWGNSRSKALDSSG